MVDHIVSDSDLSPLASSEVDYPASDLNVAASDLGISELQPLLPTQSDNSISIADSPESMMAHSLVDVGTQTDIVLTQMRQKSLPPKLIHRR